MRLSNGPVICLFLLSVWVSVSNGMTNVARRPAQTSRPRQPIPPLSQRPRQRPLQRSLPRPLTRLPPRLPQRPPTRLPQRPPPRRPQRPLTRQPQRPLPRQPPPLPQQRQPPMVIPRTNQHRFQQRFPKFVPPKITRKPTVRPRVSPVRRVSYMPENVKPKPQPPVTPYSRITARFPQSPKRNRDRPRVVTPAAKLSPSVAEKLIREAMQKIKMDDEVMRSRLDTGLDKYTHDFKKPDPLLFSESPENAEEFSRPSRIINWIATLLRKNYPGYSLSDVLSSPAASRHSLSCPFKPPQHCPKQQKYRTLDGTCNNLNTPQLGAAFTPFARILPPLYSHTNERYDVTREGSLPNPRVVSTTFHEPSSSTSDDSIFSMLITLYGQFISHDITDRAPSKGINQAILKCCKQQIPTPPGFCANFDVPQRDFFRQFGRDCMEFPRSLEVTDLHCQSGERQQLNQASSFIDGGAIYGATKNKSDSLREFEGGRLMMSVPNHLPIIPPGNSRATMRGFAFYAAGDNRVNEFIGLIGMETLWMREHNRIADALSDMNRHWNDETIYQETRRIIISMIQHITYAEYLSAILGPVILRQYDLQLLAGGYYKHYNSSVDPSLANAFAAAAMRFGHSMLRTTFGLLNRDKYSNGYTPIDLKDSFFRSQTYLLHEDPLMRGMVVEPSKTCDRVLSGGVINNLYQTTKGSGHDLAASNIQRGRDHGLRGYAEWRRFYGLSVPTRFDTSPHGFPDHDLDTVLRLQRLYRKVTDVDLFTGGISEIPVKEGAVGPLFGNILGQQYKSLKKGDRYWYETDEQPQAFKIGQLREIRKVTIARLMCNTYNIDKIQSRAFYKPSSAVNRYVDCSSIPEINLSAWKE